MDFPLGFRSFPTSWHRCWFLVECWTLRKSVSGSRFHCLPLRSTGLCSGWRLSGCEPLKSVRQLCWPGPRGASTQGHPTPGTPPPSLDLLGDNRACSVMAAAHEPPGLGNAPRSLRFHLQAVSYPSLWSFLVFSRNSGGSWRTFLEPLFFVGHTFLELVHTIPAPDSELWPPSSL